MDRWKCRLCQKWFGPVNNIHCSVLHAPRTCCHYGTEEIEQPVDEVPLFGFTVEVPRGK